MYNSNDMIAIYYCATHTYYILYYHYERTHQMHIIIYNLVFNTSRPLTICIHHTFGYVRNPFQYFIFITF